MHTMKRLLLAPFLLALLLLSGSSALAEDRIVLLTLRFDSASVNVESTSVVPGKLKNKQSGHSALHGLSFRVRNVDATLYAETLDDPRRTVREVFHEDGTIGRLVDERASGVTVIRFPYDSRATRIEFSSAQEVPGAARPLPLNAIPIDLSSYENKK